MPTVKITYIDQNENNCTIHITDKACTALNYLDSPEDIIYTAIKYFKKNTTLDQFHIIGVELNNNEESREQPEVRPKLYDYSGIHTKHDAVIVSLAADEARARATGLLRYIERILSDEFMFSPDKAAEEILTKGAKTSRCHIKHFKEWYERLSDEMCTISNLALRLQVELDCLCGIESAEVKSWNKTNTELFNICNDTE